MTKSDPNAILHSLFSAAWGQALPLGEDIFLPLALMAFPRIRPDPDILGEKGDRLLFLLFCP